MPRAAILLLSFYLLLSCNPEAGRQSGACENGKEIALPNDWCLKAQDSIEFSAGGGDPTGAKGAVHTVRGGLNFKVYSNQPYGTVDHPDLAHSIAEAQYAVDSGIWHTNFNIPAEHTGTVDTISGLVATTITPVAAGKGTVSIMMEDYLTGAWIELRGTNIPLEQQKILLEMSRTIYRKKK